MPELIQEQVAAAVAVIDFVLPDGYRHYLATWTHIVPATDGTDLILRTSTDGGATFDQAANNYRYIYNYATSDGASGVVATLNTSILLSSGAGNAANESSQGWALIKNPSAAAWCWIDIVVANIDSTGVRVTYDGGAIREAVANVDAIRFSMLAGNITSGRFTLYGFRQ